MDTKVTSMTPRAPTDDELNALVKAFVKIKLPEGMDDTVDEFKSRLTHVAMFDDYITGGPGYCGPVAMVLWDGAPHIVTTLTFDDVTGDWEVAGNGELPSP